MDEGMALTYEQAGFASRCIAKWMQICEEEQYSINIPDATHSALLMRLLMGGQPLDKPPPLSFSYPNYSLGEGKPTMVTEIREWKDHDPGKVFIDQCGDWEWVEKDKILRHTLTGDLYRIWKEEATRPEFKHGKIGTYTFTATMMQKMEPSSD